jgi:hypothetical protein
MFIESLFSSSSILFFFIFFIANKIIIKETKTIQIILREISKYNVCKVPEIRNATLSFRSQKFLHHCVQRVS